MKILAFFANGCEEIEGLTVVDLARRAGIETEMVSINETTTVEGSHKIKFTTDTTIVDVDFESGDMIFLPGGLSGTNNLYNCEVLTDKIKEYFEKGKRLAAVCAAPSVFGRLGLLKGRKAVCYPGFEDELKGATVLQVPVVTDGNITTSRGMGTTIELGLEIIRLFKGETAAEEMAQKIVYSKN